jgi:allantoinase
VTVDLVIRGGTVMPPHGRREGGVAVDGDVIVAVAVDEALPAGRETIEGRGQHVRPGTIVRGHVVMRDGELVGEPGWGKPVVPAMTVAA